MLWTVTLVACGIKEQFSTPTVGDYFLREIEDAEGRILQHRYDIVAVDEEHRLVTAFHVSAKTLQRKLYARRRPRLDAPEAAPA